MDFWIALAVGVAAGLLVVLFAPAEWWGLLRGKAIPADWTAISKHAGMQYNDYLLTDAWQQRRRFLIAIAGYRCMVCNCRGVLQLHHRTYERIGDEALGDLIVICKSCHEAFHRTER